MTTFHLKLLAIFLMIIAHLEFFFFPGNNFLYIMGRIAFPIFAFLIANGAIYTKNLGLYAKRILIFAVISQLPFLLTNWEINKSYFQLNILFTFYLSLLAIRGVKKTNSLTLKTLIIIGIGFLAEIIKADYGFFGVSTVLIFYTLYSSKKMFLFQIFLSLIYTFYLYSLITYYQLSVPVIQILPFGLLSLIFIYLYNGKEGRKLKYLFYIFYPLHYFVIYLLLRLS